MRAAAAELAELNTAETGKLPGDASGGVEAGAATLVQYAELGPVHRGRSLHGAWDATDLMVPGPRGVAVVLTPWNDPVAVAAGLIGAALVTGNTVVHKPSERCPLTGRRFAEIVADALPPGVLEIVDGDGEVGARLAAAPVDVVAHVGSTATGRRIAEAGARTGARVLLENGGNDPLVVDEDVDPDGRPRRPRSARSPTRGRSASRSSGSTCRRGGRPVPGRADPGGGAVDRADRPAGRPGAPGRRARPGRRGAGGRGAGADRRRDPGRARARSTRPRC